MGVVSVHADAGQETRIKRTQQKWLMFIAVPQNEKWFMDISYAGRVFLKNYLPTG
jgi:hypothetical protein